MRRRREKWKNEIQKQEKIMVATTCRGPLPPYKSSSGVCRCVVSYLPISDDDGCDIDEDLMEVGTIGFDRISQFHFYEVCRSGDFLRSFPFCFNPKLSFLKPQHVITAVRLEQFAFEHSQRGFSSPLVGKSLSTPTCCSCCLRASGLDDHLKSIANGRAG